MIVKNCIVDFGKRALASCRASRQRRCTRKIWCREEGTHAYRAKMLVFFARCSNPIAVFAILRALKRHRHSLRLGGQHGEEAKDEDEIGGEEGRAQDKAPEEEVGTRRSSLRLPTTSLTASHGPARVEEQ
jgi:hypothetical protein